MVSIVNRSWPLTLTRVWMVGGGLVVPMPGAVTVTVKVTTSPSWGVPLSVTRRRLSTEQLFHPRLHPWVHLDEWRPGPVETFAGQFLRCVDTDFGADGHGARRVV